MGITYSLALFEDLVPENKAKVARAVEYASELRHRGGDRFVIRGRMPRHLASVEDLVGSLGASHALL